MIVSINYFGVITIGSQSWGYYGWNRKTRRAILRPIAQPLAAPPFPQQPAMR